MIPADSSPAISSAVSRRMPVCPVASVESRSSISARTTSRSTSGPDPAACERTSDRCSCSRISAGMWRVASAPKPVEMPYAGSVAAASSSTTARAFSIADDRVVGQRDRRAVAGHGHHVVDRERADVHVHRHGSIELLRGVRAAEGRRRSCLGCETGPPLVEEATTSARHETPQLTGGLHGHRVS